MKHVLPKKYRDNIANSIANIKRIKQQELLDDSIIIYKLIRLPEGAV